MTADDHDLLRDTLVMFLEGKGCMETASAGTFQEECARIESDELFNLILLDYNMPSMNGLEGLRKAIALKDAQRVTLISG